MASASIDFEDEGAIKREIESLSEDLYFYRKEIIFNLAYILLFIGVTVLTLLVIPFSVAVERYSYKGRMLCLDESNQIFAFACCIIGTASAFSLGIVFSKNRLYLSRSKSASAYLESLRSLATLRREAALDD